MTKARITIPIEDFPPPFKMALKRLETPRRGRKRYSKNSLIQTTNALGQYLFVLKREGADLVLSQDNLALFVGDLDARRLKHSTRLTYMTGLQAIAKEVRYPTHERALILEDCEWYRDQMRGEIPRKVQQLTIHPLNLRDVAQAANKWQKEARALSPCNKQRTYLQRSAVLALLSLMPLRIGDVNRLVIGTHILRDNDGWSLQITSKKSGFRHNGTLHRHLTPYLDALLPVEPNEIGIENYHRHVGRPLFSSETGEFLSSRTLAYNFKKATGHSPHIVRTLVHDAMAKYGRTGTDLAMILCGQTSMEIARYYEVHAERHRTQIAQEQLTVIQEKTLREPSSATKSGRKTARSRVSMIRERM